MLRRSGVLSTEVVEGQLRCVEGAFVVDINHLEGGLGWFVLAVLLGGEDFVGFSDAGIGDDCVDEACGRP